MKHLIRGFLIVAALATLAMGDLHAQVDPDVDRDTINPQHVRNRRSLTADDAKGKVHGVALGVDRDTLQYIVASPFDNWYFSFGGGAQTWIGNEVHKEARRNGLNYNFYAEVGKWIIPDLSLSLHFRFFDMDGQSYYPKNPWIDIVGQPTHQETVGKYEGSNVIDYQSYHLHGWSLNFFITLDWTNLFNGYEKGLQRRFHVMTPIGLGVDCLYGEQVNRNPRITDYKVGDMRYNYEYYAMGGVLFNYAITTHLDLDLLTSINVSRNTVDFSPYDDSYSRADLIPAIDLGLRIDLFKEIYQKVNKNDIVAQEINHKFLNAQNERLTDQLRDRIQQLEDELADEQKRGDKNQETIAQLQDDLDSLNHLLDDATKDENGASLVHDLYDLVAGDPNISTVVYFPLDRYYLDHNARKTLQRFAIRFKQISKGEVFYIIGGADSATGKPHHNWELSQNRCKTIYDALVTEYGIDPQLLEMYPLGGISEYYPYELNRIGIITKKTPELTAIIEELRANTRKED